MTIHHDDLYLKQSLHLLYAFSSETHDSFGKSRRKFSLKIEHDIDVWISVCIWHFIYITDVQFSSLVTLCHSQIFDSMHLCMYVCMCVRDFIEFKGNLVIDSTLFILLKNFIISLCQKKMKKILKYKTELYLCNSGQTCRVTLLHCKFVEGSYMSHEISRKIHG